MGGHEIERPGKDLVQRVRIVACGMIAREVIAVRQLAGLEHIELTCLPAEWHFTPDRIAAGVEKAVAEARAEGVDDILVGYADCGTGGQLDDVCDRLDVQRIAGPHCFAFYQGLENYDHGRDLAAFYVTDFLARQPDAFLYRPLGIDRHPELIPTYFGAYESVVYLAQTDDPALTKAAKSIAERLGLPFERRFTGYGDLLGAIAGFGRHAPTGTNGRVEASGLTS